MRLQQARPMTPEERAVSEQRSCSCIVGLWCVEHSEDYSDEEWAQPDTYTDGRPIRDSDHPGSEAT